jgi:hypothetical protein
MNTIGRLRRTARALTSTLALALGACSWLPRPEPMPARSSPAMPLPLDRAPHGRTDNVVLVTIDGVRWQDVFGGVDPAMARWSSLPDAEVVDAERLLPNLYALARRGVVSGAPGHGRPMMASGPNYVSLPGYLEIFTGSREVGCRTNRCGPTGRRTIVDRARDSLGTKDTDVAVIASWETIANAASARPERIALSAGRHGGASREKVKADAELARLMDAAADADPAPGDADYRPDAHTAAIALRYLEVERPRVLAVNLGDTDEYAHAGDYASYVRALRQADAFLGALRERLARMGDYGRNTTVVVTCDHGRSAGFNDHGWDVPESGRVWMVASGGAVPSLGYLDAGGAERLADIAPTLEALLGIGREPVEARGTPMAAVFLGDPATRYVARAGGGAGGTSFR